MQPVGTGWSQSPPAHLHLEEDINEPHPPGLFQHSQRQGVTTVSPWSREGSRAQPEAARDGGLGSFPLQGDPAGSGQCWGCAGAGGGAQTVGAHLSTDLTTPWALRPKMLGTGSPSAPALPAPGAVGTRWWWLHA